MECTVCSEVTVNMAKEYNAYGKMVKKFAEVVFTVHFWYVSTLKGEKCRVYRMKAVRGMM